MCARMRRQCWACHEALEQRDAVPSRIAQCKSPNSVWGEILAYRPPQSVKAAVYESPMIGSRHTKPCSDARAAGCLTWDLHSAIICRLSWAARGYSISASHTRQPEAMRRSRLRSRVYRICTVHICSRDLHSLTESPTPSKPRNKICSGVEPADVVTPCHLY